jgi:2-aminoadipate transaminase
MSWDNRFAARTGQMQRSAVREILKLTAKPDVISFAGGLPAPEYFPVERIQEAADTVLQERGREVLQYSTSEGMPELRAWIATRMSRDSQMTINPDNILILSGSQQALDLVGRVLLNEGDKVIVENPTYVGMLSAWKPYGPHFDAVPTDEDGMIVDELATILAQGDHKLLYSIPSFQNPQGTTLSRERRVRLAELLIQYDLPMYEDDPYGDLVFEGEKLPSVLEMEIQTRGAKSLDECNVMYAGTFSKTLTPGLRVGWIAAAYPVIDKLVQAKQATDLHTSTLSQFITYELVRNETFLDEHIAQLRQVYHERRDLMLASMAEHFPEGIHWTKPRGGLFTVVTLPEQYNAAEILKLALQHNVAFVPCNEFYVGEVQQNTFRLNYSNARPERIVEGIRRLGTVLKEIMHS